MNAVDQSRCRVEDGLQSAMLTDRKHSEDSIAVIIIIVIEMNIIKVALSHFCCRTTVQSDSVSVARQVTVRRW